MSSVDPHMIERATARSLPPARGEPACRYVLLTAAYNEESFIARTIASVVAQTVLPARWIIVSDGSTDRTDEIVRQYAAQHDFIRLLRVERTQARGVASKVNALTLAYKELGDVAYEFIGNLDADVSLQSCYFETLLGRFRGDPLLGIAGGLIHEARGGTFKSRLSNSLKSVAHAGQLVHRKCYEEIGGYVAFKYGGEDWCAEVSARMRGWHVEAFSDLPIMHYRQTGSADRLLRHRFREGRMDFSFGSHPVFELFKCARRLPESPFLLGALVRLVGFLGAYLSNEPRLVPPEFVAFLRREQKHRLRVLAGDFSSITANQGSSQ